MSFVIALNTPRHFDSGCRFLPRSLHLDTEHIFRQSDRNDAQYQHIISHQLSDDIVAEQLPCYA